jgi:hypothetical protein
VRIAGVDGEKCGRGETERVVERNGRGRMGVDGVTALVGAGVGDTESRGAEVASGV